MDWKKHDLQGVPDGMTIDTDGNLWIANFDGSVVVKYDPRTGTLLQTIKIPALQVTSVAFGGKNLDELYVTTASMHIREKQDPPRGAVFKVTGLGVKGYPGTPCVL
jgi:gluconolactonase